MTLPFHSLPITLLLITLATALQTAVVGKICVWIESKWRWFPFLVLAFSHFPLAVFIYCLIYLASVVDVVWQWYWLLPIYLSIVALGAAVQFKTNRPNKTWLAALLTGISVINVNITTFIGFFLLFGWFDAHSYSRDALAATAVLAFELQFFPAIFPLLKRQKSVVKT